MTNKNTLISGDNKGYAAYQWEHDDEGVRYLDDPPEVRRRVRRRPTRAT